MHQHRVGRRGLNVGRARSSLRLSLSSEFGGGGAGSGSVPLCYSHVISLQPSGGGRVQPLAAKKDSLMEKGC